MASDTGKCVTQLQAKRDEMMLDPPKKPCRTKDLNYIVLAEEDKLNQCNVKQRTDVTHFLQQQTQKSLFPVELKCLHA